MGFAGTLEKKETKVLTENYRIPFLDYKLDIYKFFEEYLILDDDFTSRK
mgnify:CR=1 FL=1